MYIPLLISTCIYLYQACTHGRALVWYGASKCRSHATILNTDLDVSQDNRFLFWSSDPSRPRVGRGFRRCCVGALAKRGGSHSRLVTTSLALHTSRSMCYVLERRGMCYVISLLPSLTASPTYLERYVLCHKPLGLSDS